MKTRVGIFLALSILTACADNGAGPRTPRVPPWELGGLPLAAGNRWSYDLSFDISWTTPQGANVRPPEHLEGTGVREIAGVETIDGREYAVEAFTATADGEPPRTQWRRYRQDETAFYQADVSTGVPPGEVPTDLPVGDQTRLRFPVAVGDTWRLRPGSDAVTLTVVARDTLALAIGATTAWRVRRDVITAGPDDYVFLWYNALGLMRSETHVEFNAQNQGTGEIVHVVTHEVQELVSADLVELEYGAP